MGIHFKYVFISLLLFFTVPFSNANPRYIGGQLGLFDPNVQGLGSEFAFGAQGGFFIKKNISLGLVFLSYSSSAGSSLVTTKVTITPVLFEGAYHFESHLKGLYAGGRFGFISTSVSSSTIFTGSIKDSDTDLAIGGFGGYNYRVNKKFSVGGEVSLTITLGDSDIDALGLFGFGRFWF